MVEHDCRPIVLFCAVVREIFPEVQIRRVWEIGIPLLQHHVGGENELDAGEILDGKIIAKSDETDDQSDEEASEPLHEYVLEYLSLSTAPPILLEEFVLKNPAKNQRKQKNLSSIPQIPKKLIEPPRKATKILFDQSIKRTRNRGSR